MQAPSPIEAICQRCDRPFPATLFPFQQAHAAGRKLLQGPGLPCCSTSVDTSSFCGSLKCTVALAAGLVGVLGATLALVAMLVFYRYLLLRAIRANLRPLSRLISLVQSRTKPLLYANNNDKAESSSWHG